MNAHQRSLRTLPQSVVIASMFHFDESPICPMIMTFPVTSYSLEATHISSHDDCSTSKNETIQSSLQLTAPSPMIQI